MAGKVCDVCGKDDLPTSVRSSGLGAFSFAYCGICSSMGAEPKGFVEGTIENIGGIEKVHKGLLLTYYDIETDSYIDVREGKIPITYKDGSEVKTRSEAKIFKKGE